MSSVLFAWLSALVLLVPERLFSWAAIGHSWFEIDLLVVWIFYLGINFSFGHGLLALLPVSYLLGFYTYQPPILLILSHVILFLLIKILMDQIMTEAYLTKMVWTMFFLVIHGFLIELAFESSFLAIFHLAKWQQVFMTALVSGLLSLPLMVVLDYTHTWWLKLLSSRKAQLTAADFYQAKSGQRKYLK